MQDILKILNAGLSAADGEKVVSDGLKLSQNQLTIRSKSFDLDKFTNIYVLGAGKVAGKMALGAEKTLDGRILDGLIVVKEKAKGLKKIKQVIGNHPMPDKKSLSAGMKLLRLAREAKKDDLVIFLLSGGASSLAVAPSGISLSEKQKLTKLLLECGADIKEINTVRKHLSRIKGGGLAEAIYPATCITLVISDVLGNDLSVIGSGPTVKDKTTYLDCIKIMQKYGLDKKVQRSYRYFKQALETSPVNSDKEVFSKTHNSIIADLDTALSAVKAEAEKLGYKTKALNKVSGVAANEGRKYAKLAQDLKSHKCLIGGGETTVVVKGAGEGGRNLELILGFLKDVQNMDDVEFLSVNTDGEDGTSGVAGALVTEKELTESKKFDIDKYLKDNNSLPACQKLNCNLEIPKNQTNVGDIQILLRKQ